jgi:hypothetical protein
MQLPWGREKELCGVIDLVGWRALRWDEASLGREIAVGEVPEELREEALHARHELLEVLADEVDSFTEAFLERENEVSQAEVLPRCARARWAGASRRRCAARPSATSACSPCWMRSRTCCPGRTRSGPLMAPTRRTARPWSARPTPGRRCAR